MSLRSVRLVLLSRLVLLATTIAVGFGGSAIADSAPEYVELGWEMREQLYLPVDRWLGEIANQKNEDGREYRRGTASKTPRTNAALLPSGDRPGVRVRPPCAATTFEEEFMIPRH